MQLLISEKFPRTANNFVLTSKHILPIADNVVRTSDFRRFQMYDVGCEIKREADIQERRFGSNLLQSLSHVCILRLMSTAQEIEDAIRALPASERDKLVRDIPNLFPEFADEEWQRIIDDARPRPALSKLLNQTEAAFRANPDAFPEMKARDFDAS